MGIADPYFPKEIILELATIANANVFVETGTYLGGTTKSIASFFKKVHTIELSEALYEQTKDDLAQFRNIVSHLGDSRSILPHILLENNENIVFWLDGHYSGGITAGEEDPCPLINELNSILSRNNDDIIIIDDARLINEGMKGYPSITEIYEKMRETSKIDRCFQICDDHLYIIPNKAKYVEVLLDYVLKRSVVLWDLYSWSKYISSTKGLLRTLGVNILEATRTLNTARKIYKRLRHNAK